jgi:predicted nucleic acid-binding protein
MGDIVIDTNVLEHTFNPKNKYHQSANEALNLIKQKDIYICVDDVFDLDSSENTSIIGHEYIERIRADKDAYIFLLDRIINGKYKQIFKKDFKHVKQKLRKKNIKSHDIVFVMVACGSDDKTLVSNDYEDFSSDTKRDVRGYISKEFDVSIINSDEYILY